MVRAISDSMARELASQVRDSFPDYFRSKFKDGFRPEYKCNPNDFTPQGQRTYYQGNCNARPEGLVAITFSLNNNPSETAISLGRLLPKHKKAAPGWWYLREVICNEFPPRAVRIVKARLESPGGRKSFKCLEERYPSAVSVTDDELSATVKVETLCRG